MHPRWFLLVVAPDRREYVSALLITNRYRFEQHDDGFLVFARCLTSLAQWLTKQGVRIRTVALLGDMAAA